MKNVRIVALLLALVLMLGILGGCKKEPAPVDPIDPNPVDPVDPVDPNPVDPTPDDPTVKVYPFYNPLTGEGLMTDVSKNRPYAIMLNNLTRALPQYGVSKADIIYEVLAEGGITRMMALYQDVSDVGNIGSIRSARHYYIELAQGHDAVYIHAGGSPMAYDMIANGAIASVDGTKGGISNRVFFRDQNRIQTAGLEHSMFTSGERLTEHVGTYANIRHEHYDGFAYTQSFVEDGTPKSGTSASLMQAFFTPSKKTAFQYDSAKGLYGIFEYGAPYVDGSDNGQVFVENVLILFTDVALIPGDAAGRLNVRTTGTGTGYFACGGKYVEINWSRPSASVNFQYTLKDGTPVSLGVGTSYVCVLGEGSEVTFANE